jgi:AAHS family 4-hydroxybenzoate transporter-like MFS transporter
MSSRGSGETTVAVDTVLDEAPFARMTLRVTVLCALALILDGFDILAISFVAPALTADWGVARSSLGPVLAAALLGMALGALGIGPVGDRWGRKTALVLSVMLFSSASLLSATANDLATLAIYRFITGLGLGGALPNATALMAEFTPIRWRNLAVSFAIVGVPIGGMLGAKAAAWLIPTIGWRAIFFIGAVMPALLVAAMWVWMPESPRFLAGRTGRADELARLLNRVLGTERYVPGDRFMVRHAELEQGRSSVGAIFAPGFRYDTVVLWFIFLSNVFAVYAFFNWLPTVLSAVGLPIVTAIDGSFMFNLGGVVGALAGAVLMSRLGSRPVLAALALGAILSTLAIAQSPILAAGSASTATAARPLMWLMAAAGACIAGLQVGMYSVAAHVYPTACRSTGVGWSLGIARLGGILSSFGGAVFFARGLGAEDFFTSIAGVMVVTLTAVLALRRHMPKSNENASRGKTATTSG